MPPPPPTATPMNKANTKGPKYLLYNRIEDFASQLYNKKRNFDCFNLLESMSGFMGIFKYVLMRWASNCKNSTFYRCPLSVEEVYCWPAL